MFSKRGLSTIVTILLIILFAFIMVAIVWVAIKGTIDDGTEKITLDSTYLDLSISKVLIDSSGIFVSVKRGNGKGEMNALKFVISDGVDSEVIDLNNITLNQLDLKTFNVTGYQGLVKEISVAPTFYDSKGKRFVGEIKDTYQFEEDEVIKNIPGILSWWKFDSDTTDSVGRNYAKKIGSPEFVNGKFGGAMEFESDPLTNNFGIGANNDYLRSETRFPSIISEFSVFTWIKINPHPSNYNSFIFLSDGRDFPSLGGFSLYITNYSSDGGDHFQTMISYLNSSGQRDTLFTGDLDNDDPLNENEWTFVGMVFNGTTVLNYVGSKIEGSKDLPGSYAPSTSPFIFGAMGYNPRYFGFNGSLDNVMVFNRALNSKEVEGLYNFNFGGAYFEPGEMEEEVPEVYTCGTINSGVCQSSGCNPDWEPIGSGTCASGQECCEEIDYSSLCTNVNLGLASPYGLTCWFNDGQGITYCNFTLQKNEPDQNYDGMEVSFWDIDHNEGGIKLYEYEIPFLDISSEENVELDEEMVLDSMWMAVRTYFDTGTGKYFCPSKTFYV